MKAPVLKALLARDPVAACAEIAHRHGGIVKLPAPERQGLWIISDPELVNEILVTPQGRFDKGGVFYQIIGRALGQGLFTTNDPALWQRLHDTMWPTLRQHNLGQVNELALELWQRRMDSWNERRPIALFEQFKLFSIELLAGYLFGAQVNTRRLVSLTGRVFAGMSGRVFLPTWFPGGQRYARAISELMEEIDRIIEASTGNGTLIDALRQADFTPSQMRDQAVTMLMAGHDSSATVLAWAMIRLGERPDVYASLRVEALQTEPWQLAGLTPLAQFFQAAAHDHPAFPMFPRNVAKTTRIGGRLLRAGDQIVIAAHALHHDPRFWHSFDDFYEALGHGLDRAQRQAHLPFGKGRRKCIGEDFAVYTSTMALGLLLRRFSAIARVQPSSGERSHYHMTAPPRDGAMFWLTR